LIVEDAWDVSMGYLSITMLPGMDWWAKGWDDLKTISLTRNLPHSQSPENFSGRDSKHQIKHTVS